MDRRAKILRFGLDGWHARYEDGFNEANVVRLADALGLLWADASPGAAVFVGFDTRHNMHELARVAASVIASYGLRAVVATRPTPTPAVAWACAQDPGSCGAVILTSSERSCEYGGVLVRGADGGDCPPEFLERVEQAVSHSPTPARGVFEERDLALAYEDHVVGSVDARAIADAGLRVVVDPMFGAGTGLLAHALERLGCEVREIHGTMAEDFEGMHPVPQDPWADECEQAVVAAGAQLGLLLDGDADRAAVVDERGTLVPVRSLVPLMLGHLVENRHESGTVVTTLTSSACVGRQAARLGCRCAAVPVGFYRIYREAAEGSVLLGAEEYGGMCVPSHLLERDGIYVCVLMVELLAKSGRRMSQLVEELEDTVGAMRYSRRDVHLDPAATQAFRMVLPGLNPGELAGMTPIEVSHADGLKLQFADDSWVMVRPSRAAALVRVYAEASTTREADDLLEAACELVRRGI